VRPDRDDGLDRAMRRALQDSGTDCPDVNDLAAYAERTLSAPQRRGVEGHLSRCARCRETLLLMEKGTAPVLQETKKGGGPLYWLVGAAAAGLATVLWIAQPDRKPPTAGATAPQTAQKFEPAAPPTVPQEAPGSFADKVVEPPATKAIPESTARERNRAADAVMKRSRDERKQEESARKPSEAERAAALPAPTAASPPSAAAPVPELPPAAAPAPAPAPETMTQASARAKVAHKEAERQGIARQDRRMRSAPDNIVASSAPPATADKSAAADASPAIAWRVWTSGKVERSTDGGATWSQEPAVDAPGARAIHAPSPDVCWIVGDGGLILRYERTRGWMRLSPPTQAGFVAVRAIDAMQATITTGDGRRFTTADGGTTWK
jgi:hypothetical protein